MQRIRIPIPWLVLLAALALAPRVALAEADDAMSVTDRNGDGHVDRREYQTRQTDVFYFEDDDKDGALGPGEAPGLTAERVKGADRNGDGKLQLEEWLAARARDFDAADRNGDGALDMGEVQAAD